MIEPAKPPRQLYLDWVEEQIEEYKAQLPRDDLLSLADQAIEALNHSPDGQYRLTELLLRDAVDALIFRQLGLPTYRQWLRLCHIDTTGRPPESTPLDGADPANSS